MRPAIRFEHVSKKYRLGATNTSLREALTNSLGKALRFDSPGPSDGQVLWALRDVSFELPPGRALGLIGPNGSGKTTTLKLLANITKPFSGNIEVNGRLSALIELGAGVHPDLTGRENIYLYGTILGLSRKEISRSFDRIVAFSGLERFIDTPLKRYSSGMYVRLGFSVAAHVEPDILLVDEVLAVGDAQFRQKCSQQIEYLQKRGTTIVFVAHNLYLVKSVCDTAILLKSGQIQAQGDVVDVINVYEASLHQAQIEDSLENTPNNHDPASSSVIEIIKVEIDGPGGTHIDQLSHDDAVEVRVHFLAKEPIPKPNLVLRLVRADGTTCSMIRTADYGYNLDTLKGEGLISVVIDPLQLVGGAYSVDARILGVMDGVPLAQGHSRRFQVSGISLTLREIHGVYVPRVVQTRVEPINDSIRSTDNGRKTPSL